MISDRIVFIVEGDCELYLINQMVIPYLYGQSSSDGWTMNAQKITTNRKMNMKGGNIGYQYLKNEVLRIRNQKQPWITTFLDFFRIPNDFPGYSEDANMILEMEKAMQEDIAYSRFFPYIQKHEFETLLFADISAFKQLCTDKEYAKIQAIIREFPHIEDINHGISTAPSKRLAAAYHYNKVADSSIVLKDIGIETIMNQSPGFAQWINTLLKIIRREPVI